MTCDQILLLGFVPVPWVAEADLASFTPVSGSSVTDDFCDRDRDRDREDDCIWRLRLGGGWLYVYLLIKFQSTIDRYIHESLHDDSVVRATAALTVKMSMPRKRPRVRVSRW